MNPQHGHASIFGGLRNEHLMHFFGSGSSFREPAVGFLMPIFQLVVVDVGDKTEPGMVVAVVEDQAVSLPVGGA